MNDDLWKASCIFLRTLPLLSTKQIEQSRLLTGSDNLLFFCQNMKGYFGKRDSKRLVKIKKYK